MDFGKLPRMLVRTIVPLITDPENLVNYLELRLLQITHHYLHTYSLWLKQHFYLSKRSNLFKLALSCSRFRNPSQEKPL